MCDRNTAIRAVSIDMSVGYEDALPAAVPDAEICFDPFHVVTLANEAVNDVRRSNWNARGKSKTATASGSRARVGRCSRRPSTSPPDSTSSSPRFSAPTAPRLGMSNARQEGLNSKVRLISHRSFDFDGPDAVIAVIYLCAGRITIDPPFATNS